MFYAYASNLKSTHNNMSFEKTHTAYSFHKVVVKTFRYFVDGWENAVGLHGLFIITIYSS